MTQNASDADILRHYLLGSVTPEAREAVERRLFSEDQIFWEHLCLAEEELIDDYARGCLDADAAARFEQHFLCTEERRGKLEFSRVLKDHVDHAGSGRATAWQRLFAPVAVPAWAMAAAALLLLATPVVLWQTAGITGPPAEIAVRLSPGVVRGVDARLERVAIPERSVLVRLNLDLGIADYEIYRASLYTASEDEIWSQGNLRSTMTNGSRGVILTLPADLLPPDDYSVRLTGVPSTGEPVFVDRYDFRVPRRTK